MVVVGLTGGIGSGKSTVAELLRGHGATVISADDKAHAVIEPGASSYEAVVARFGNGVVDETGRIDRSLLAGIVFHDEQALADLEAIVHPAVHGLIEKELAGSDPNEAVILEVPLLLDRSGTPRYRVDGVLVVHVPDEVALERLVSLRDMSELDARARLAASADRGALLRAAQFIIVNMGTKDELSEMVDRAWSWIEGLRAGTTPMADRNGPDVRARPDDDR